MKFHALSILALGLSSPAIANADQFDLICRGTVKRTKQGATENVTWVTRYRIDLHRKVFCANRCASLESIYQFDEGSISLNQYQSSVGTSIIIINRMSGALSRILVINSPPAKEELFESVNATCHTAQFSGIPRKF